jgi:hypothetical protein
MENQSGERETAEEERMETDSHRNKKNKLNK